MEQAPKNVEGKSTNIEVLNTHGLLVTTQQNRLLTPQKEKNNYDVNIVA